MKRHVQPELLDTLSPDDPRAIRSRLDLRRINWWMANHVIMARALQNHLPAESKQITELGAGDGNFLLRVLQKLQVKPTCNLSDLRPRSATLLDLQKNISAETLADISALGWHAEAIVADVFDWPKNVATEEVVVANLLLHHFEDVWLAELLGKISQRARLFIAIEPHRFAFPSVVGQLLWLIGCNDVTRHDATVSIRAGFMDDEISALWPDKANWQLTERRAGWSSHLFIAQRRD